MKKDPELGVLCTKLYLPSEFEVVCQDSRKFLLVSSKAEVNSTVEVNCPKAFPPEMVPGVILRAFKSSVAICRPRGLIERG